MKTRIFTLTSISGNRNHNVSGGENALEHMNVLSMWEHAFFFFLIAILLLE